MSHGIPLPLIHNREDIDHDFSLSHMVSDTVSRFVAEIYLMLANCFRGAIVA